MLIVNDLLKPCGLRRASPFFGWYDFDYARLHPILIDFLDKLLKAAELIRSLNMVSH